MMNLMKDILMEANELYCLDEKRAFERDCTAKLKFDIAAVIVGINSPTFSRIIRNIKATTFDKLAVCGKFLSKFWSDQIKIENKSDMFI